MSDVEGVGRSAQGDDGNAAQIGGLEFLHHIGFPAAEAEQHDNRVSLVEGPGIGQQHVVTGLDHAIRPGREQHGAVKAVPLAENLAQHRQSFLAAILVVTGEEHDFLPLTRAILGGEVQETFGGRKRHGQRQQGEENDANGVSEQVHMDLEFALTDGGEGNELQGVRCNDTVGRS